MCFHPIKIRNPSMFINPDIDKPWIEVPCGHCEECLNNRLNDLVVRSYYEWQDAINVGGFAYFDTLTYNEKHVPRLGEFTIFNRDHLTKFFKRVRSKLTRQGFDVSSRLKYIVTTEYGENERYTKRPHYHVLWFCSVQGLTVQKLYSVCRQVWTNEMQLGWNDKITCVLGHVINRLDGIRYVCKYIAKERKFNERFTAMTTRYKMDKSMLNKILENVKNIKPFYRCSIGFGKSILDVSYDQLSAHGVPVYTSSGLTFYSIPKYIKTKLFFDKVNHPFKKSKLLRRNDVGVDYLVSHIDEVIDAKVLQYKNILENESIFNEDVNLYKDYIYQLLDGRSIRDFLIYKNIYKGHLFSELSWHSYKDYFYHWLKDPKKNQCPWYDGFRDKQSKLMSKERFNAFLSSGDNCIIDDQASVDWFGFDEIDALFDLLFEKSTFFQEQKLIRKDVEEERTKEIVERFAPRY